jgi:hypothetical protein
MCGRDGNKDAIAVSNQGDGFVTSQQSVRGMNGQDPEIPLQWKPLETNRQLLIAKRNCFYFKITMRRVR